MNKFIVVLIIISAGCGSLTHGTWQEIPISSNPDGATVIINSKVEGTTPITVKLKRKTKEYNVVVAKKGYMPFTMFLIRKTSTPSAVGNFMLDFGLISHLIIDKGTGGAYKLTPDAVHVELKENKKEQ